MELNITKNMLTPNKWSRPQTKLKNIRGIVYHWTAAPNQKVENTRGFFENRKYGKTGFGSAHYIIGTKGEILQCLPDNELGYHVGSKTYTKEALSRLGNYPNNCTIGIELEPINIQGEFSKETLQSAIKLGKYLLEKYNLTTNDIWTHYGVVGWKDCPRWWFNHPSEFEKFKQDVQREIIKEKVVITMSKYFKDVPANHWSAQVLDNMKEKGLLAGKSDGTFGLGENIKREEAVVMISRAIDYVLNELK